MISKYKKLISVVVLSISGFLPLFTINNRTLTINKQHQSKSILQTSRTKQVNVGRKVHKFTGLRPKNDQNLFQKLQEQLTTTNINIELNSGTNYNYAIKYDNYDVFHAEHKGQVSYIDKTKSTNNSINVGIKLLDKMSIYISKNNITKNSQKNWKSLKLNSLAKLDYKKVDPASVFYSISASGTKSSPTVTISRSYTSRDSKTTNSQIFGYFNVSNLNHNAKYFFSHASGILTIIAAIILVLIILAVVAGSIFARMRFNYIKKYNGILDFRYERAQDLHNYLLNGSEQVDPEKFGTNISEVESVTTNDIFGNKIYYDYKKEKWFRIANDIEGGNKIEYQENTGEWNSAISANVGGTKGEPTLSESQNIAGGQELGTVPSTRRPIYAGEPPLSESQNIAGGQELGTDPSTRRPIYAGDPDFSVDARESGTRSAADQQYNKINSDLRKTFAEQRNKLKQNEALIRSSRAGIEETDTTESALKKDIEAESQNHTFNNQQTDRIPSDKAAPTLTDPQRDEQKIFNQNSAEIGTKNKNESRIITFADFKTQPNSSNIDQAIANLKEVVEYSQKNEIYNPDDMFSNLRKSDRRDEFYTFIRALPCFEDPTLADLIRLEQEAS